MARAQNAPVEDDMTVKPDDLAAGDESGSDYRRLFFMYLGLALKYRWLILSISCVALMIGFYRDVCGYAGLSSHGGYPNQS